MEDRKPVIRIQGLVARYGDATILDNVNLDLHAGQITVVVGGSGCGKSTLLKHIIGLYKPWAGTIEMDGKNVAALDDAGYRELMRNVGILYQSGALLGSLTVGENIALPILEYTDLDRDSVAALVRVKLGMVHLSGYENHLPSELSGGMLKRAGLARAMALNPKILFFDEPSAGLDPITAADLDQLILRLSRLYGTTMVVVTHELRSIFTIADRCVMLDKSTRGVIADGDPRVLKETATHPAVRRFFNPELIEADQEAD
jgi:phospholipid/cholesterol/gamma-HCH transport system ATP-binding protein